MNRLSKPSLLKIDIGSYNKKDDRISLMNDTYRDEGLSVGLGRMRFNGNDIDMEVRYEDIDLGKKIGSGACSQVYVARHRKSNGIYAVKMFNIYDKTQSSQLLKEIGLLTVVDCEALISLKGAFHKDGCIGVIIEYMDKGSIDSFIKHKVKIPENVLAAMTYQVLWGLGYLHYDNKLHRDIKPANVLINSSGEVKISDFGIAKELDSTSALSNTSVGTFKYMSPERLLGARYDKSADIWSVGIMLVELWTHKYPFSYCSSTPIDLISELETFDFDTLCPKEKFPRHMKLLIQSMLKYRSEDRKDCTELLQSTWFLKYEFNTIQDTYPIVKKWLNDLDVDNLDSEATNESKNGDWNSFMSPARK